MFKETSEKQELTKQWSTNKVLDFPTAFFFFNYYYYYNAP